MRLSSRLAAVLAGACWSSGCAAELGSHAGASLIENPARFAMAAHVGMSAAAPRGASPMFGFEVEGATRSGLGSAWTVGLLGGYRYAPDQRGGAMGFEALLEGGVRLDENVLAPEGESYGGISLAVPIWLGSPHEGTDLNESYWLIGRGIEVVPSIRGRLRVQSPEADGDRGLTLEVAVGIAGRVRFTTDLL